ncbi:MAG: thiamine phosphate synthase [Desulfobacteraceae bacterium]|jgi:thiamine-phosphate pyrophosphorylase
MKHVLDTDIYGITGEEFSKGRNNLDTVSHMIQAGIKIIQYREKEKHMGERYRECQVIREMTLKVGVTFIVNDHVDLALAVSADGIHVGQDDMPLHVIRRLTGGKMIIGLSTHSPEQAQRAVVDGADYIGVGPIFNTTTKKDVVDAVGFDYLDYVVKNIPIPFVAIGGIKEHNAAELVNRGAYCLAMITELVAADDMIEKIKNIRNNMKKEC